MICYVDNTIILTPKLQDIKKIFKELKKTGLELTMKKDLADFLKVYIETLPDNKDFYLHQSYQI